MFLPPLRYCITPAVRMLSSIGLPTAPLQSDDFLLLCVDPVDLEALRLVEKERSVNTSSQPAVEVGGVVCPDDEEMFGCGNAVGVVVNHRLIAIKGETIVHVALDGVGGDELHVWSCALNLTGQGTGGVVYVKLFAVEAEQEDECCKDRN